MGVRRVQDALVSLAGELARVLPRYAPVLSRDLHDLSPALPESGHACPTCNDSSGEDPGSGHALGPCREHPRGGRQYSGDRDGGGSAGGSIALVEDGNTVETEHVKGKFLPW
jgi:hypothetical protein